MIEETTPPRNDFFLKLASEADMPTVLSAFYKQDMEFPIITPREVIWSYDMTAEEYAAYRAAEDAEEDVDVDPVDFISVPEGVAITGSESNDAGTLTFTQSTPPVYGEEKTPVGDPYMVKQTPDYAIDIVGVIHRPTGNTLTDADGNEYPEQAPLDGWHVNIRLVGDAMRDTVEALDVIYGVQPQSPARIFL